mgnify:FL=1
MGLVPSEANLSFVEQQPILARRKTRRWGVYRHDDVTLLGTIRWWARWRRYAFFPSMETLFDAACLQEVAAFLAGQMAARKA